MLDSMAASYKAPVQQQREPSRITDDAPTRSFVGFGRWLGRRWELQKAGDGGRSRFLVADECDGIGWDSMFV